MLFLLISTLWATPAEAACEEPVTATRVAETLAAAMSAARAYETDRFREGVANARASLPCLDAPLPAAVVGELHTGIALDSVAARRPEAESSAWFAAALAITPDLWLDPKIAPEDGAVDRLLDRAKASESAAPVALPPFDGETYVDGTLAASRPSDRPYLLQLLPRREPGARTYLLLPEDALPDWDAPPSRLRRLVPDLRERPSVPFLVAGGTSLAASAVLYGVGSHAHAQFEDPATPYEDLPALQDRTNAALAGSIGLGIATVGFATAATFSW